MIFAYTLSKFLMGRRKSKEIRPTFFKVLIGDFSKQLRIPPAFVKNFNGNSLGKYVVKGPTGRYWAVNMEEKANRLFFGSGWQDFVKYHCLEFGDFLVLKYCGNSRFKVKIYDKTCCQKVIKQAQMNNDHPDLHSKKGNQYEDRHISLQCKLEVCEAVNEKEPIYFKRNGCRRLEKKLVNGVGEPTRSFLSFKSDNSCFIINWTDHNRYCGTIPIELAREKNLMTKWVIVVTDPDRRSWPVELSKAINGRLNMKGEMWNEFWRRNEVETGDILIFEFMNPATALQVHIFQGEGRSKRTRTMVFSTATVKKFEAE